jgi:hypothetical protein
MDEKNNQQQIEVQPQETVVQQQPQQMPQKKSNVGKIFCIGCSVLIVLTLLCAGIFGAVAYFGAKAGLDAVKSKAVNTLCNQSDSDIEKVYQENTTENFKLTTSEEEFKTQLKSISDSGCTELKNAGFKEFISKGWSINTETDNGVTSYNFKGKVGGKDITLYLVDEDGTMKIDEMQIQ